MRAVDALQREMPRDLVGKFDIVHVRLFMFVVEEPSILLKNAIAMLSMRFPYSNNRASTLVCRIRILRSSGLVPGS